MEFNGTIKAFYPHKGWGFVDCNGQDMFLHKKNLKGFCPSKGNQVQFTVGQTEKGPVAENVKVVSPPEETSFYGSIKSYNHRTGYGFISSEAFDQDVFVLWWDLPFGFGPRGSPCKFSISMDAKGPAAKKVVLLGAAGSQIQQVEWMMGGFDTTCWDLNKNGTCPRAAEGKCRWHPCKDLASTRCKQAKVPGKRPQLSLSTKQNAVASLTGSMFTLKHLNNKYFHSFLVGCTGIVKTIALQEAIGSLERSAGTSLTITMLETTSSGKTREIIQSKIQKSINSKFALAGNERMLMVVDDLHMPRLNLNHCLPNGGVYIEAKVPGKRPQLPLSTKQAVHKGQEAAKTCETLESLGQGSFGQILKCQVADSCVALKISNNRQAYFNQGCFEANMLKRLNSSFDSNDTQHIVRMLDCFVFQKHLCIASELTPTIDNNLNPDWKDGNLFTFSVNEDDAVLEMEVMNANVVKDDSLGKASLRIGSLEPHHWTRVVEELGQGPGGSATVEVDVFFKPNERYHLNHDLQEAKKEEKECLAEASRLAKEVQMAERATKWLDNVDENTKMPLSIEERDWSIACGGRNFIAPAWITVTQTQVEALVRARKKHPKAVALFRAVGKASPMAKHQKLKVKLMAAFGLEQGSYGECEMYCSCEIPMKKHSKLQTDPVPAGANPEWRFSRSVKGYDPGDALVMEVYSRDRCESTPRADQLLGRAFLPGDKFYPNGFDGLLNLTLGPRPTGATLRVTALVMESSH